MPGAGVPVKGKTGPAVGESIPLLFSLPSGAEGPSDVVWTHAMWHPGGLPVGASLSVWVVWLGVEWSGVEGDPRTL